MEIICVIAAVKVIKDTPTSTFRWIFNWRTCGPSSDRSRRMASRSCSPATAWRSASTSVTIMVTFSSHSSLNLFPGNSSLILFSLFYLNFLISWTTNALIWISSFPRQTNSFSSLALAHTSRTSLFMWYI